MPSIRIESGFGPIILLDSRLANWPAFTLGRGVWMLCLLVFLATTFGLAMNPVQAREYLKTDRGQLRSYSPGVVTEGGKTAWVSGQTGLVDETGKSMAGDFEGQVRVVFRNIDAVIKRVGGSLKDVVTMTVYLTDPRLLDPFNAVRREFWPDGNFPASVTITVHSLPAVGMMLEVSSVAVVGDK